MLELLPTVCPPQEARPAQTRTCVTLITAPFARMASGRAPGVSSAPEWSPAMRSMLLSAATGGQWPQVRIARIRGQPALVDIRCQLCKEVAGTLLHRRSCPVLLPTAGWSPLPAICVDLANEMSEERRSTLQTRGLYAVRLSRPEGRPSTDWEWIVGGPEILGAGVTCFTDGSAYNMANRAWATTGCGLAITGTEGQLLGVAFCRPRSGSAPRTVLRFGHS